MDTFKSVLIFIIGAGVGAAAGWLTAPRSGKKTREMIIEGAEERKVAFEGVASKTLEDTKNYLIKTTEKQGQNGKELIEQVKK